jgi:hypothetical protein
MDTDKLAEIANIVYEKTKAGEILWEKTSEDGAFQTSLPKYSIIAFRPRGGEYPLLRLFNERGELLEEFSPIRAIRAHFLDKLIELYDMVRRKALGVDEALDDILKVLASSREKK